MAFILALWIAVRVTLVAVTAKEPHGQPLSPQSALVASAVWPGSDPADTVNPAGKVNPASQDRRSRWQGDRLVAEGFRQNGAALAEHFWRLAADARARPARSVQDQVPVAALLADADMAAGRAAQRGTKPGEGRERRPLKDRSFLLAKAGITGQTKRQPRPRWSADSWVLLRGSQSVPALAAGAASYGGSQGGAVLRYSFAPESGVQPRIYLRAARALAAPVRQAEGALGLMARPVPRLPFQIMGEMRVQDNGGQVRVRPVVTAVSELRPTRLPMGAEAEVYAQVGWAGGRGATAFYDVAAVAQRRVAVPAPGTQLRMGGGLWSGGQRGAARLDFGPRLEVRGMVGPETRRIGARLAVDWRFRVAGDAEPGSGPALTLAAGF